MSQSPAEAESPLSPAAAFAVLTDQQNIVASRFGRSTRIITVAWGVAWLLGFLSIWLMDSGLPAIALPVWLGWTIFAALFAGAVVVSAAVSIRGGRGIRSNAGNAFAGTIYGITWILSILAINVFGAGLISHGLNQNLADLFYPSAYTLVVGLMYLSAAAIWRVGQMFVAGVALVVLAAVAPFFGHPTNWLVFAIVGGVLFFTLAIVSAVRVRSVRIRG
jgi:hypothetical protein